MQNQNNNRQIFVDTETTGLNFKNGDRIIEFGAVEVINRKVTNKKLHFYFNVDIKISEASYIIHNISNEFLEDKPTFKDKVAEIMDFLKNAEVLIHNAKFDVGFINNELNLLENNKWGKLENICKITDTLEIAKKNHPGQKISLDSLCKKYFINNSRRTFHGALLDSEILAEIYLAMTGGQESLLLDSFSTNDIKNNELNLKENLDFKNLEVLELDNNSCKEHQKYLNLLSTKINNTVSW